MTVDSVDGAHLLVKAAAAESRRWDLASLKRVGVGAEPIVPSVMRDFADLIAGCGASPSVIIPGYGMTETGALIGGGRPLRLDDDAPHFVLGPPARGVGIRIVDDGGVVAPEGIEGHIQIRAPGRMFAGYVGRPDLTAECYTDDGWFRTGDRGRLVDGALSVTGRSKDVLVINGKKYPLAEIEAALHDLPAVDPGKMVACAVPSPEGAAEALAVFFEPLETTPAAVGAVVGEVWRRLARRPGIPVRFVIPLWPDQIPRTASGKLRRARLAQMFLGGELRTMAADPATERGPPRVSGETDEPTAARVAALWQEALGLELPPNPGDDFFEQGGGSLASAEFIDRLEKELGRAVPIARFLTEPTLGHLLCLLDEATAERQAPDDDASQAWPLPPALRRKQLTYVGAWKANGGHPTASFPSSTRQARARPLPGSSRAPTSSPFWPRRWGRRSRCSACGRAIGS